MIQPVKGRYEKIKVIIIHGKIIANSDFWDLYNLIFLSHFFRLTTAFGKATLFSVIFISPATKYY